MQLKNLYRKPAHIILKSSKIYEDRNCFMVNEKIYTHRTRKCCEIDPSLGGIVRSQLTPKGHRSIEKLANENGKTNYKMMFKIHQGKHALNMLFHVN